MARDSFVEFIGEQLAPLGGVALRPMFGMVGVFCDGVMLGIAGSDALYLRSTTATGPPSPRRRPSGSATGRRARPSNWHSGARRNGCSTIRTSC